LTARQVEIGLTHENAAVTKQGVGVLITGQAMFKIAREPERLRAAAERFIGEPDSQIETMVKKVLEGSLRSIAGTLTIEELITDRDRFQQAVSEAARGDLEASGIHIDALTITSIRDTKGYIEQLGEKNLASVVRDARIAKAGASGRPRARRSSHAGRPRRGRRSFSPTHTASSMRQRCCCKRCRSFHRSFARRPPRWETSTTSRWSIRAARRSSPRLWRARPPKAARSRSRFSASIWRT